MLGLETSIELERIELKIEGMSCNHCSSFVDGIIATIPGVIKQEVLLEENKAIIWTDSSILQKQEIADKINETETYKAS